MIQPAEGPVKRGTEQTTPVPYSVRITNSWASFISSVSQQPEPNTGSDIRTSVATMASAALHSRDGD